MIISRSKTPTLLIGCAQLAAVLLLAPTPAGARSRGEHNAEDVALARPAGVPLMAIVSLREQRVTIYDADGKILRAPVSTGQTGYETPAGIYSVIQKEAEHYSNLYDDASMPFMQRITWSGIALHAGVLPGHPASHGCIRMPYGFAERLFDLTKLGMRVLVVPSEVAPVPLSHPALFRPMPIGGDVALTAASDPARPMRLGAEVPAPVHKTLKSIAEAKAEAVNAADRAAEEARQVAQRAGFEAARATRALRMAEGLQARAQLQLKETERALASATSPEETQRVEEAKAKIIARLNDTQKALDAAKAEGQPKIEAAAAARETVKEAMAAKLAALAEAKEAAAKLAPVSVLISRQTQHLYVRQSFQPLFEVPVTIADPDRPIGTHVYTALGYIQGDDVRWSAVSMSGSQPGDGRGARRHRGGERGTEPSNSDAALAKAALDRVTIPKEALERISEVVSPGSSLIISDEAMSKETSKGTDFIVLMSGEPQGGIKMRRRHPYGYGSSDGFFRPYARSPYRANPYSWW
jgi:hypothetical protein